MDTIANVEMAAAWDGDEGDDWAREWERYDRAVRAHHLLLLDRAAVAEGEHVLDVGCGTGEVTRDVARGAVGGTALGVDLSTQMIERARELAVASGIDNARFERGDAQVHPFETARYDMVVSRFGTMFFADPSAAFTNLARATRPGGRLVMIAWHDFDHNEWLREIRSALAIGRDLPTPPPGTPGPVGLCDPELGRAAIETGGYRDITFDAIEAVFTVGVDVDDAFAFMSTTGVARGLLHDLDSADRARALDALRATMERHDTGHGVEFGSTAWLVTARRPTP